MASVYAAANSSSVKTLFTPLLPEASIGLTMAGFFIFRKKESASS